MATRVLGTAVELHAERSTLHSGHNQEMQKANNPPGDVQDWPEDFEDLTHS